MFLDMNNNSYFRDRCISEDSSCGGPAVVDVLPVAVVVVVLLVVEAAVLEALVPFLVPVTNSIYKTRTNTRF